MSPVGVDVVACAILVRLDPGVGDGVAPVCKVCAHLGESCCYGLVVEIFFRRSLGRCICACEHAPQRPPRAGPLRRGLLLLVESSPRVLMAEVAAGVVLAGHLSVALHARHLLVEAHRVRSEGYVVGQKTVHPIRVAEVLRAHSPRRVVVRVGDAVASPCLVAKIPAAVYATVDLWLRRGG